MKFCQLIVRRVHCRYYNKYQIQQIYLSYNKLNWKLLFNTFHTSKKSYMIWGLVFLTLADDWTLKRYVSGAPTRNEDCRDIVMTSSRSPLLRVIPNGGDEWRSMSSAYSSSRVPRTRAAADDDEAVWMRTAESRDDISACQGDWRAGDSTSNTITSADKPLNPNREQWLEWLTCRGGPGWFIYVCPGYQG